MAACLRTPATWVVVTLAMPPIFDLDSTTWWLKDAAMSREEVDSYLAGVEEPGRSTLESLRKTILKVIPQAEECISYKVPAYRVGGNVVAGFAAFKNHLSYLPFSGSVLSQMQETLTGYTMTKSALHFPADEPLPADLVRELIRIRMREGAG